MAKKGRPQRAVKGFRPGKEPAHLKKQRVKAELGKEASWGQKQAVELVAGRKPEEVQRIVRRWTLGVTAAALVFAVGGIFLYGWTVFAGVAAHVVALGLFFAAYRMRKQEAGLIDMAKSLR